MHYNSDIMDILILIFLIALNGLFSLSEMSVVASNKNRLQTLADSGQKGAKAALALGNDPNRILATTQLGLIFITLLQGAMGSQLFAAQLGAVLPDWSWLESWKGRAAEGIVLALITFFTLIFGEMLPKRAALGNPEVIACVMAPMALKIVTLFSPLIGVLSFFTNRTMAFFGLRTVRSDKVSEEDVEVMLRAAGQAGLLTAREMTIMDNVWRLNERKVGAVMTPRQSIRFIDIAQPNDTNLETLISNPNLRLVVVKNGLDCVLGLAPTKQWTDDLMRQFRAGKTTPVIDWTRDLSPAHSIPNSLNLIETLESFRSHQTHVGMVYNEFGQVEGIVSMSDLMDALVGEMPRSPEQETLIHKDPAGRWLIDGLASITDTKTALDLSELPGESQANFQTAGGFALWMIGHQQGRLPKEFDEFVHGGLRFQIVDIDRSQGYRIDQIMVEHVKSVAPAEINTA